MTSKRVRKNIALVAFMMLVGLSAGWAADLETVSRPLFDPFHSGVHHLIEGTLQILPKEPQPEVRDASAARAAWKPPQGRAFVQEEVSSEAVPVPRRVINPTAWPNSPIGLLKVTFPNGHQIRATGIMVGPRHVLTAGHCLFDYQGGLRWAKKVTFAPARDGNKKPFGTFKAVALFTTRSWTKPEYNLGMVALRSLAGQRTGWHSMAARSDEVLQPHTSPLPAPAPAPTIPEQEGTACLKEPSQTDPHPSIGQASAETAPKRAKGLRINVTGYQGKRMLGAEGYVKAVDAETFDYAPSTPTDQIGAPVRAVQKGSCDPTL